VRPEKGRKNPLSKLPTLKKGVQYTENTAQRQLGFFIASDPFLKRPLN
jgi:hypothetical protein